MAGSFEGSCVHHYTTNSVSTHLWFSQVMGSEVGFRKFQLSWNHQLYLHWTSLVAQLVKNLPAMWETWIQSLGWEDPLEKGNLSSPVFWPGEFHGLQSMGVAKSQTQLSDFPFPFHTYITNHINQGLRL